MHSHKTRPYNAAPATPTLIQLPLIPRAPLVPVLWGALLAGEDPGAVAPCVPVLLPEPGAAVTGPADAEEAAVEDGWKRTEQEVLSMKQCTESRTAARNRSFDWKVVQLDDAGMRGVYGG